MLLPTKGSIVVLFLVFVSALDARSQSRDAIFTAAGFQQNHDYFTGAAGDHVDTGTGALIITHIDLVFPGDGGSELRFSADLQQQRQRRLENRHRGSANGGAVHHDYFSGSAGDNIDTGTGALIVTHTDLVFPGDGGSELRFQRTYNSKGSVGWGIGIVGLPMRAQFDLYPNTPAMQGLRDRKIGSFDGGLHLARYQAPGTSCPVAGQCRYYLTKEFWLMDTVDAKVYMPDGGVGTYEITDPVGRLGRLIEYRDAFNNKLTFSYNGLETTVRQFFSGTVPETFREIRFKQATDTPGYLRFYGDGTGQNVPPSHEWTYTLTGTGDGTVFEAESPEGTTWRYEYGQSSVGFGPLLELMETPSGGIVTYEYEARETGLFVQGDPPPDPAIPILTPAVVKRSTGGTLPSGDWLYNYASPMSVSQWGTIKNPDETFVTVTYTYQNSAIDEFSNALESQVASRVVRVTQNGPVIEEETRSYGSRKVTDPVSGNDAGRAVLTAVALTRDGVTYTTTHEYRPDGVANDWADYHRPWRTTESSTGGNTRTTTRTFTYSGFAPRILGKLGSEVVAVQGLQQTSYTKSWTYNTFGFTLSETAFGRVTSFTPDLYGNVRTATRGNQTTTFSYDWGVISRIETAAHTTVREIDPAGLVTAQTQGLRRTEFDYDKLFRIVSSTPPEGDEVTTTYSADGQSFTVARGSAST